MADLALERIRQDRIRKPRRLTPVPNTHSVRALPRVFQAVDPEPGEEIPEGEILVKQVELDGTLVGDEIALLLLAATTINAGDYVMLVMTADGRMAAMLATAGQSRRVRFKSMGDDYTVCRTWDGTTEGDEDVLVAKPWLARRTPFDGQTRNGFTYTYSSDVQRESDSGTSVEDQVVIPGYVANFDEIFAISTPIGGTGVVDGAGNPVVWREDSARAFGRAST